MVQQPLADLLLHGSRCPGPILFPTFPRTCPCAVFNIDAYGDHVHTSLGHSVRSQAKVTASAGHRRVDIEMVDYLDSGRGSTNLVLDLSFVHERHGASRANPQDNGKLIFTDFKRVDQPLEDRARTKTLRYAQDYANNTRSVFAPAVASTSGHIQAEFIWLRFLHAHREAEEHVKLILGMTGVAAQPNISDDYFQPKRTAFLMPSIL